MSARIKEPKSMTLSETIRDLEAHIERLTTAHNQISAALGMILKNHEALAADMELARQNMEILQNIYLQKNARQIGKN
jgi:hypothetical protein